jgi:hypothetical protein
MNTFKLGLLAFSLLIIANCAPASDVTTTTPTPSASMFPAWYTTSGFTSDSTGFSGFGTAVAADSSDAVKRAEVQARLILETEIAKLAEDVRLELVETGSNAADNTDFIIILRSAHAGVEQTADIRYSSAVNNAGIYRAFVSVFITKSGVVATLEDGFTGHPRYWGEYSGASKFEALFK